MTGIEDELPAPRPHLIHVGYAKSGSSFLRRWFAAHPEIGYRPDQFAGFARLAHVSRRADGVRLRVTSSETFASPTLPAEALEPGAFAAAQATACSTLAELFPAAHILIVTRGFRSMIMSSYSQYVRSGGSLSLEELVGNAQRENPWDYDWLSDLYRKRFGPEKVLVLPWELLRDDPAAFVGHIERRFDLSHIPPSPQRVNASLSPIELRWYPKLAAAVRKAPVGLRLRGRLAGQLARMSHRNSLAAAVRLLQRLAPQEPVAIDALPPATVEAFRGKARGLAADPLYAPYLADYLNDDGF